MDKLTKIKELSTLKEKIERKLRNLEKAKESNLAASEASKRPIFEFGYFIRAMFFGKFKYDLANTDSVESLDIELIDVVIDFYYTKLTNINKELLSL